jgi:hypothetical protein
MKILKYLNILPYFRLPIGTTNIKNLAIYNSGKLKTLKNHFIVSASSIFEISFW